MGKPAAAAIDARYRDPATIAAIRTALRQDPHLPSVALNGILTSGALRAIDASARSGWRRTGVPDRESLQVRPRLAAQSAIRAYAGAIVGARIVDEPNRRFGHRDFTLLHDHERPTPGWRALLFLDDVEPLCGGQLVFVKDGETLGRVVPQRNTLLLVLQRPGVLLFFQYVNHRIGKRSVRVLGC